MSIVLGPGGVEFESAGVSKRWRAARLISVLDSNNAKTKHKAKT